jgi:hypothetical protein
MGKSCRPVPLRHKPGLGRTKTHETARQQRAVLWLVLRAPTAFQRSVRTQAFALRFVTLAAAAGVAGLRPSPEDFASAERVAE